MSFYESNKPAIDAIISSVVTLIGGITIKDWWTARREKNQDNREEKTVAISTAEGALKMMEKILEALNKENEDCQEGMRELREEMKQMREYYESVIKKMREDHDHEIRVLREQINSLASKP